MQQLLDHVPGRLRITAFEQPHPKQAGLSVYQRDQEALTDAAVNCIALPVSDSGPAADFLRPFRDRTIRLNAVIVGISGIYALSTASEVLLWFDFRELFLLDIPVNCGCAELFLRRKCLVPTPTDLLRGPEQLQPCDDVIPLQGIRLQRCTILRPATAYVKILRMPKVIPKSIEGVAGLELRAVSVDLAADGRWTSLQNRSDLSKR